MSKNDKQNHSNQYIDEMFADHTGVLAGLVPGYGAREGQTQLARAIHDAIANKTVLLGEAPTGTGKTMAYLIPAIMHAARSGQRVLVVTANKALQEQLIEKDLPLLVEAFRKHKDGHAFSYALIKGRANYLCQRELWAYNASGLLAGAESIEEAQALSAWGMATITGDQSDAPAGVSQKTWSAFSITGDRCSRRACAHYNTCFSERASELADAANVVVANYDLFFSKILYTNDPMWHRFETVIFDEAHEAANIARRCFGRETSLGQISQVAGDVSKYLGDHGLAKQLRTVAAPFFEEVMRYALNMDTPRVNEPNFVRDVELVDVLDDVARAAKGNCGGCDNPGVCGTCIHRNLIHERTQTLIKQIREFVGQTSDTTAYWIEKPFDAGHVTSATVRLRAVPYRVGAELSTHVFTKYPSVIAVSATMTSGGSFDFIREELGLVTAPNATKPVPDHAADVEDLSPIEATGDDYDSCNTTWTFATYGQQTDNPNVNVHGLRVPTPFNFAKQAKFIVPLGIPWPIAENDAIFNQAAADAIRQLVQDCQGRTLALFTSWRRLKYVAEQLAGKIDYPLLVQGDCPNKTLAQMFRDDTHSVLLATKSFWMGLDVQGESLSCLVIDKLPLESFTDPLIDMMKQRHPETFWDSFYFPRAAIELAQGAGRLIRSTTDRGVFVLLDSRIISKAYGGMMRRSLPFNGFSKNLADAGRFLAGAQ
jgi:ATP-dependent DNA helicase DinG